MFLLFLFYENTYNKGMHIYELTCPRNINIDYRNKRKTQKYTIFITNITGFQYEPYCFEERRTGFISNRNKATFLDLYKLTRKELYKSTIMKSLMV